jgi:hypothetical protein
VTLTEDVSRKQQFSRQSAYQPCHIDCSNDSIFVTLQIIGFEPSGTVKINNQYVQYSYDPDKENKNELSIQQIGAAATSFFNKNHFDLDAHSLKVLMYFGRPEFGNMFVTAALDGKQAPLAPGVYDFARWTLDGRQEFVKKGTAYLILAMQVLIELENSVTECAKGCTTSTCSAINSLEKAVAYYTGSLEGSDGKPKGVGMHQLASDQCINFNMCRDGTESMVNREMSRLFYEMKRDILGKNCAPARTNKDRFLKWFYMPFIQGTLRSAYITSTATTNATAERDAAEGLTYATSVLPLVQACNKTDSRIIWNYFQLGYNRTNKFNEVKQALERNYRCMNIFCNEVGGLWDYSKMRYFPGAEPCRLL